MLLGMFLAASLACAQQSSEETLLPSPATKAELDIAAHFCDQVPREELCSVLPKDVTDFSASFVYMLIEQNAQNPFDLFSWKTFIALTWPVDKQGKPLGDHRAMTRGGARLWQTYSNLDRLYGVPDSGICQQQKKAGPILATSLFLQAQGSPLVDQKGNYVVFDVRINPVMEQYIRDNDLNSLAGQQTFMQSGKEIDFPKGYYDDSETRMGGEDGALEIKTAWRILESEDEAEKARFIVVDGLIEVNADDTMHGNDLCLQVKLGLVGFHIVRRTQSGNGGDWIWTTFEHVDNAPYANKARGPNSVFSKPLFPEGCTADADHDRTYSFFNSRCPDCEVNIAPVSLEGWKWSSRSPYAGEGVVPAQVARCWKPSLGTRWINRVWQKKLAGTPWQYYALSTTQWKGANEGQLFPHGEVPRYLTNSTMESYIQTAESGTCLGCHAEARTAAGQPANFSFVLSRVPVQ